jgi:polyisoprenoid-binding protein YceI
MKKIIFPLLIGATISCGTPNVEVSKSDEIIEKKNNSIFDSNATQIGFGAFKTTEKKEVKGWFNEFQINQVIDTNKVELAFANATFTISVNSLETNDSGRNQRILTEFFAKTNSTDTIKGKVISFNKDSALIKVKIDFNAIQKEVPFQYSMSGDTLKLNATINLLDFNAIPALESLNKACEALHKGSDGVSKTWSDVNLYLNTVLRK